VSKEKGFVIRDKDHRIKKLNERIATQEGIVDDRKQLESDLDREKKAHAVTKVLCDSRCPRCIFLTHASVDRRESGRPSQKDKGAAAIAIHLFPLHVTHHFMQSTIDGLRKNVKAGDLRLAAQLPSRGSSTSGR
jgi:hypothetical protein